jgi:hypothetical protein
VWETNNTHRNNCYDIAFTLNDGTPAHVARFRVK